MEKRILLRNRLNQLNRLGQELESLGNEWDIKPEIIFSLSLVLEELFVIYYAGIPEQKGEQMIEMVFTDMQDHLKIELLTVGKKFNPLNETPTGSKKLAKISSERETGGLGIGFVMNNLNSAAYQRKKDCNILTLKKFY